MFRKVILAIIKFYRSFLSPGLGRHCRFYPSCSAYAIEVIDKYGVWPGLKKSCSRILRCHPFNSGGVDLP